MQISKRQTSVFWLDALPHSADFPASPLPEKVDVAIIGGGYTGLNAARVLARHGIETAVLEQHRIGAGASGRNAGITYGGANLAMPALFERYGEVLGREIWQASLDGQDLIGEIVADEEIECHFARKGQITLAAKPRHLEQMTQQAAWLQKHLNYQMEVLSAAALSEESGVQGYVGGVVDALSAALQPAAYAVGLAAAAARYGAILCEETAVTQLQVRPHGFNVHTSRGIVAAQEVILATNGYTGDLAPLIRRRVYPVSSYRVVTEPLPAALQAAISANDRCFADSRRLRRSFRLTPDGRFLFGGPTNLTLQNDVTAVARQFRKEMTARFPALADVDITHVWGGRLGMTFDGMPHIGRAGGVHYALGYNGHGLAMATYLGVEIGLLMAGKKTRSPFVEIPHPRRFYYRKRPWFLPWLARRDRFLDWLA